MQWTKALRIEWSGMMRQHLYPTNPWGFRPTKNDHFLGCLCEMGGKPTILGNTQISPYLLAYILTLYIQMIGWYDRIRPKVPKGSEGKATVNLCFFHKSELLEHTYVLVGMYIDIHVWYCVMIRSDKSLKSTGFNECMRKADSETCWWQHTGCWQAKAVKRI